MFNPAPSFASHSWIGADIHGAVTYQSANTRSFTIVAVESSPMSRHFPKMSNLLPLAREIASNSWRLHPGSRWWTLSARSTCNKAGSAVGN